MRTTYPDACVGVVDYKNQNGKIVILLCGDDKSTQKEDILKAHKIAQEENV